MSLHATEKNLNWWANEYRANKQQIKSNAFQEIIERPDGLYEIKWAFNFYLCSIDGSGYIAVKEKLCKVFSQRKKHN